MVMRDHEARCQIAGPGVADDLDSGVVTNTPHSVRVTDAAEAILAD